MVEIKAETPDFNAFAATLVLPDADSGIKGINNLVVAGDEILVSGKSLVIPLLDFRCQRV